jgi:hypothetical protein
MKNKLIYGKTKKIKEITKNTLLKKSHKKKIRKKKKQSLITNDINAR